MALSEHSLEQHLRVRRSQAKDMERARRLVVDKERDVIVARRFWSNTALTLAGIDRPDETGAIIDETLLRTALMLKSEHIETRFYEVRFDDGNGEQTWANEDLVVTQRRGEPTELEAPRHRLPGEVSRLLLDSTMLDGGLY